MRVGCCRMCARRSVVFAVSRISSSCASCFAGCEPARNDRATKRVGVRHPQQRYRPCFLLEVWIARSSSCDIHMESAPTCSNLFRSSVSVHGLRDSLITTSRMARTALWLPTAVTSAWSNGKGAPQIGPGARGAGEMKRTKDQEIGIT